MGKKTKKTKEQTLLIMESIYIAVFHTLCPQSALTLIITLTSGPYHLDNTIILSVCIYLFMFVPGHLEKYSIVKDKLALNG